MKEADLNILSYEAKVRLTCSYVCLAENQL